MRYKNNPANIRYNKKNNWLGQLGSDNGFCVFDSVEHGLRALIILLRNYINVYKLHSVQEIISRFAPACENDTCNYIHYVNGFLRSRGVDPDNIVVNDECLVYLGCAICRIETNSNVFLDLSHIVPRLLSNPKK